MKQHRSYIKPATNINPVVVCWLNLTKSLFFPLKKIIVVYIFIIKKKAMGRMEAITQYCIFGTQSFKCVTL